MEYSMQVNQSWFQIKLDLDTGFRVRCFDYQNIVNGVVLFVPGGPGITSTYLNKIASDVALKMNCAAAILDLPGHWGELSERPNNYFDIVKDLAKIIDEIQTKYKLSGIVGHSLGCRFIFDSLQFSALTNNKILFMNFPTSLQPSIKFREFTKNYEPREIDETSYAEYWRKILPIYFANQVIEENIVPLVDKTRFIGNLKITDDLPPLYSAVESAKEQLGKNRVEFIVCDSDYRLPESNDVVLKNFFKDKKFVSIKNTGHFPMIEKLVETTLAIIHALT